MTPDWISGGVRIGASLAPIAAVAMAIAVVRPRLRQRMAALLAGLFALGGVVALNAIADVVGWWRFEPGPGQIFDQPVDLILSWAALWGSLFTVLDRVRLPVVFVVLLALDLVAMPLLSGVTLGEWWLVGEIVGLGLLAVPAVTLGRLTTHRRRLATRTGLQVAMAALLLYGVVPLATLALKASTVDVGGINGWLGLQIMLLGTVLAVSAVWEFYDAAQGTPWPWDPPRRVVTTGPYRFTQNPMQLGTCILLTGQAVALWHPLPALLALAGMAFSATQARWHEDTTIARRDPEGWETLTRTVRPWRLRWRPGETPPATMWIAQDCGVCRQIGAWIESRNPVALHVRPAESHPTQQLRRARYETSDGRTFDGVDAIAHACEHLSLDLALVGFLLRLPGVRSFAGLVGDTVGFGPIEPAPCREGDACRAQTLAAD